MNRSVKVVISALGTSLLLMGGAVTVFAHPASIAMDPRSGPPGNSTNVYGEYFGEGAAVQIHWGSAYGPLLGTATGPIFYTRVTLPAGAADGSYSIVAVGQDNTGTVIRSTASYTIASPVAAQTPAPAPSAATAAPPRASAPAPSRPALRNVIAPIVPGSPPQVRASVPVDQAVASSVPPAVEHLDVLGMRRALWEPAQASGATPVSNPRVVSRHSTASAPLAMVTPARMTIAGLLAFAALACMAVLGRHAWRRRLGITDEVARVRRTTSFREFRTVARPTIATECLESANDEMAPVTPVSSR